MNTKQEAKLNMYRATEKHCDDNAAIIALTPAFQTAFNNFKAKIAAITTTTQQKDVALTGITVDKSSSKQTLAQIAVEIAGIVYAFASTTANNTLKQEVNFSLTTLLKTKADQLAPRCQNIHDKASANLAALADYGITPALLTNLQTAITNYAAEAPKPRTATSQRMTMNANLRNLFKEADAILRDQMDKLVVTFKTANPDFVQTYESNRIIIDPATTTTQLKGTVTNKADGSPIKGATITVVELSKTAKTDSFGKYLIKPITNGKYTIRATATGFNDFEADDVEVKMGTINNLEVELVSS